MEHFAKYYKCALQVNPYSYSSFRGEAQQEEAAYNEEILNKNEAQFLVPHFIII